MTGAGVGMAVYFPRIPVEPVKVQPTLLWEEILKCYPYRMQVFRELKDAGNVKRVHYCQWFIEDNTEILDQVLFTDEAWFHLQGYVNSHNYQT
ncbi:hypothetical protein J6590_083458 [Homalodisca vitripennis]|nr:hypothetical protein J6590_083458 [Homalodisca vitripennis]